MSPIEADHRAIDAQPAPEEERLFAAEAGQFLDLRLRLARRLHGLERLGSFHLSGCSSIVQFAVRHGIPAGEARMLVHLGRALETPTAAESVEQRIRAGKLPVENASWLGKLLENADNLRPKEDWFARAESLRTCELRRAVRERLEEIAQGTYPLVSMTLHVTEKSREDFRRAHVLVCREAALTLTDGQTFSRIVRFYLDEMDERRRGPGPRRVGPTAASPADRYIPAEVRRAVLFRSGDRCEVPGCENTIFLQFAHVHPHAEGSGREEQDLVRLCTAHHTQFDADYLVLAGWRRDGPDALERPRFVNARGQEITCGASLGRTPIERSEEDDDAAIARRRTFGDQVAERPPPAWSRSA